MIQVLIADDSPTQRRLIRAIIESDPALSVVGEARTGEEAVALCPRLQPDLVTLDILMPGIGGYEALRQIMSQSPRPVVVLTAIDSRQLLDVSFKALALGALTVAAKPVGFPPYDPAANNLITQIKAMAGVKVVRRTWAASVSLAPAGSLQPSRAALSHLRPAPKLVAIGVSTGGPPALETFLSGLPLDFPLPIVIVQHISPGFASGLAHWLSETTHHPCTITARGDTIQPGGIYLAPDNCHLVIKPGGLVWLDPTEPVGNHRPAVNVLFQSVARNYGPAAIGVLMTGMGEDGAHGLLAMRQAGAYTLAQDEASCVVFGMPKAAIDLGAVEEVLPLDQIAARVQLLASYNR
jgi:two-component system, chemotaxis family, protein-glutamate methylesterase/glutaminase